LEDSILRGLKNLFPEYKAILERAITSATANRRVEKEWLRHNFGRDCASTGFYSGKSINTRKSVL
jgi:hypothetical protein